MRQVVTLPDVLCVNIIIAGLRMVLLLMCDYEGHIHEDFVGSKIATGTHVGVKE